MTLYNFYAWPMNKRPRVAQVGEGGGRPQLTKGQGAVLIECQCESLYICCSSSQHTTVLSTVVLRLLCSSLTPTPPFLHHLLHHITPPHHTTPPGAGDAHAAGSRLWSCAGCCCLPPGCTEGRH